MLGTIVVVVDRGYGLGLVGYIINSFINLKNSLIMDIKKLLVSEHGENVDQYKSEVSPAFHQFLTSSLDRQNHA